MSTAHWVFIAYLVVGLLIGSSSAFSIQRKLKYLVKYNPFTTLEIIAFYTVFWFPAAVFFLYQMYISRKVPK